MTISASSGFDPEIDTILNMGLQLTGLVSLGSTASAQQISHARRFLDALLKSMKNSVFQLKHREPATLALAVGDDEYELASDIIEIDFPIMLTAPGETTEWKVDQVSYEQHQETVDKQTTGLPIRCYVEKLATVTLRFWPVPDKVYTASYRQRRLVRNADSGTTLDMTQGWIRGVSYQIAADMGRAGSMDLATVKDRQDMADREFEKAKGREVNETDMQFVLPELH